MNRRIAALASVALLCSGVAFSSGALAQSNTVPGVTAHSLAPLSAEPTRGVVFFTAAINSDGSVASCFECNQANTQRLGLVYIRWILDKTYKQLTVGADGFRVTL